jgi:hypothetical protein
VRAVSDQAWRDRGDAARREEHTDMETVDMDLDLDVGSARDEESCRILKAPGTRSASAKSHREVVRH